MELRFLAGYITGCVLLSFLHYYDFEWYVMLVIGVVVYAGMKALSCQLFDK